MAHLRTKYRTGRFAQGGLVVAPAPEAAEQLAEIDGALPLVEAEIDLAKQDIAEALEAGDAEALASAYHADTEATIHKEALEAGKQELEQNIANDFENAVRDIPIVTRRWLREHPEYIEVPEQTSRLNAAHHDAVAEGFTPHTQKYIDRIAEILAESSKPKKRSRDDDDDEPSYQQRLAARGVMTSAPVSRESGYTLTGHTNGAGGSDGFGRITLTPAMKEAAKIAGVDLKTYAEQLIKLNQEKAMGRYGGDP